MYYGKYLDTHLFYIGQTTTRGEQTPLITLMVRSFKKTFSRTSSPPDCAHDCECLAADVIVSTLYFLAWSLWSSDAEAGQIPGAYGRSSRPSHIWTIRIRNRNK